jgi:hypothetical protein
LSPAEILFFISLLNFATPKSLYREAKVSVFLKTDRKSDFLLLYGRLQHEIFQNGITCGMTGYHFPLKTRFS